MTPMGLDNRPADRQSHPDPLGLGCKERLKDLTDLLRIEATSGILNLDQHTVRILCRLDEQLSRQIVEGTHRVDAIHDQVNQDLLQLHPVAEQTWQISGKISAQGNTVSGQLIAQEPSDVLNDLIDVQCCPFRSALYQLRANSRNNGACPGSVIHDFCNRLPQLLNVLPSTS